MTANLTHDFTFAESQLNLSASLIDSDIVSGYIVSIDNCTGSFFNESWVLVNASSYSLSIARQSNFTVGCSFRWMVFINDSLGTWNDSEIDSMVLTNQSSVSSLSTYSPAMNYLRTSSVNASGTTNANILFNSTLSYSFRGITPTYYAFGGTKWIVLFNSSKLVFVDLADNSSSEFQLDSTISNISAYGDYLYVSSSSRIYAIKYPSVVLNTTVPSGYSGLEPIGNANSLFSIEKNSTGTLVRFINFTDQGSFTNPWNYSATGLPTAPIAYDFTFLAIPFSSSLKLINSITGSLEWNYPVAGSSLGKIMLMNGTAYAVQGGNLYSIDMQSSAEDWIKTYSSSTIVALHRFNNKILVLYKDGTDAYYSSILYQNSSVYSSSLIPNDYSDSFVAEQNSRFYVLASNGSLYSYNLADYSNVFTFNSNSSHNSRLSWANNSLFLTAGSSLYALSSNGTADTRSPWYSNVSYNSTVAGNSVLFSVQWYDNKGLSGYLFDFDNCLGSYVRDDWAAMPSNGLVQVVKTLNSTEDCTARWVVYVNDTSNRWNSTGEQSFTVKNLSVINNPAYMVSESTVLNRDVTIGAAYLASANESRVVLTLDDSFNVKQYYLYDERLFVRCLYSVGVDCEGLGVSKSNNLIGKVFDYSFSKNAATNLTGALVEYGRNFTYSHEYDHGLSQGSLIIKFYVDADTNLSSYSRRLMELSDNSTFGIISYNSTGLNFSYGSDNSVHYYCHLKENITPGTYHRFFIEYGSSGCTITNSSGNTSYSVEYDPGSRPSTTLVVNQSDNQIVVYSDGSYKYVLDEFYMINSTNKSDFFTLINATSVNDYAVKIYGVTDKLTYYYNFTITDSEGTVGYSPNYYFSVDSTKNINYLVPSIGQSCKLLMVTVHDRNGVPVVSANVSVQSLDKFVTVAKGLTSNTGIFTANPSNYSGSYGVSVSKGGYQNGYATFLIYCNVPTVAPVSICGEGLTLCSDKVCRDVCCDRNNICDYWEGCDCGDCKKTLRCCKDLRQACSSDLDCCDGLFCIEGKCLTSDSNNTDYADSDFSQLPDDDTEDNSSAPVDPPEDNSNIQASNSTGTGLSDSTDGDSDSEQAGGGVIPDLALACSFSGSSCKTDSNCCEGLCIQGQCQYCTDANSMYIETMAQASEARRVGGFTCSLCSPLKCAKSSDCCNGFCNKGICMLFPESSSQGIIQGFNDDQIFLMMATVIVSFAAAVISISTFYNYALTFLILIIPVAIGLFVGAAGFITSVVFLAVVVIARMARREDSDEIASAPEQEYLPVDSSSDVGE